MRAAWSLAWFGLMGVAACGGGEVPAEAAQQDVTSSPVDDTSEGPHRGADAASMGDVAVGGRADVPGGEVHEDVGVLEEVQEAVPAVSAQCTALCAPFGECPLMDEDLCHTRCMAAGADGCALDCLTLGTTCAAVEYCLDLDDAPSRPWTEGGYGAEWRDLAGPFVLDTLDGPWDFEASWSGKDSYLFFGGMTGWAYTEELLAQSFSTLITTLPKNVHLFFLSHDEDPAPMLMSIKAKVDEALDLMNPLGACRWRHRVHYVTTPTYQDTSWVGPRFYGVDADSGQTVITRPAYGVDRLQRIRQFGMLANVPAGGAPELRALSYEPLFFNFEAEREAAMAEEEAVEVTVLDAVKTGGTTLDALFPSADEMAGFDTLRLEIAQHCDGHDDANCGAWDKEANLFVCSEPAQGDNPHAETPCQPAVDNEEPEADVAAETMSCECAVPDGTVVESTQTCRADGSGFEACSCPCNTESARWITTYGREGRWVFDISEYLPLYAKGGAMRVRLKPGNGGYVTTIRFLLSQRDKEVRPEEMVYLYSGGAFNEGYNAKYEPKTIMIPEDVERVSLVALISGHGWGKELANCAEFCNHTHHFTLGADEYVRSHEATFSVGSSVGCAGAVSLGVVPNQYGTWPIGRAGWCPGLEVPPWVVDVTDSVTPGEELTLTYKGLYQGEDYVPEPHPDPPGGFGANVHMSSWLVYHR